MEEELKPIYQTAIYRLRNILVKLQNTKTDIKDIKTNIENNLVIDNKIFSEEELTKLETILDENIKRIANTIYSLSSKI